MIIQVLHYDRETDMFDHVADVDYDANTNAEHGMEYAFSSTQNLEGSWSQAEVVDLGEYGTVDNPDYNPSVRVLKPLRREMTTGREYGHRSTSVGDRMIVDGDIYEVSSFGFSLVRKAV